MRKVSGDLITNRAEGENEVQHEGEGRDSADADQVKACKQKKRSSQDV